MDIFKRFVYCVFIWVPLILFMFSSPLFEIIYGFEEGTKRSYKILENWEKLNVK